MTTTIEEYFTSESGLEIYFEFDCDVTLGTENHYSNHYGNWLPGDSTEVKITAIRRNGKELFCHVFDFFYAEYGELVKEKALKEMERAA